MVTGMLADRKKVFQHGGRREDVEGHGGRRIALRAKRYFSLRGPAWFSIVLGVENLAMPRSAQVHP